MLFSEENPGGAMPVISAAGYGESLEDRIYEAAVLPEFWPDVLRDFALFADSRDAILIATNGAAYRWVSSSEHFSQMAMDHYAYPEAHERTRRLLALRRAGFVTDGDVFTPDEVAADPLFNEFLIPRGYGRGVATAVEVSRGETIVFHAEGEFHRGPYDPSLVLRLDALRPHLARSALLSARLAFERARTAVETLAGLGLAACAVTVSGAVLVANADFDAANAYWTTRGKDRVGLLDRRADQLLADALGSIASDRGVRSLPLIAGEETPPAVLHVVPIRRAAHDLFGQAAAILVLSRASSTPTDATPLLQALFDLSAAEADVASRIAAGQTVAHIALSSGKSGGTVRNQLKSVLAKTGCARQADLARLLTQLVPTPSTARQ